MKLSERTKESAMSSARTIPYYPDYQETRICTDCHEPSGISVQDCTAWTGNYVWARCPKCQESRSFRPGWQPAADCPLIFLDFDGVIRHNNGRPYFEGTHLQRLRRVCELTGARIVIVSDLRLHATWPEILDTSGLADLLFHSQLSSATPHRLPAFGDWQAQCQTLTDRWCIIDDRGSLWQYPQLVKNRGINTWLSLHLIEPRQGFTSEVFDQAVTLLGFPHFRVHPALAGLDEL